MAASNNCFYCQLIRWESSDVLSKDRLAKTGVEQKLRKRTIIPVRQVLESETQNLSISEFQFSKLFWINLTLGLMVLSNGECRQAASLGVVIWAPVICIASPSVSPPCVCFNDGNMVRKVTEAEAVLPPLSVIASGESLTSLHFNLSHSLKQKWVPCDGKHLFMLVSH